MTHEEKRTRLIKSLLAEQPRYRNIGIPADAQGFAIGENNALTLPQGAAPLMRVPSALLPECPVCGKPMTMNLRSDDKFVEDEGWREAAARYDTFLRTGNGRVLFLELGVGFNTPVIIKYPFWQMTAENPAATYACVNYGEAFTPEEIKGRSICINGDIGEILSQLK